MNRFSVPLAIAAALCATSAFADTVTVVDYAYSNKTVFSDCYTESTISSVGGLVANQNLFYGNCQSGTTTPVKGGLPDPNLVTYSVLMSDVFVTVRDLTASNYHGCRFASRNESADGVEWTFVCSFYPKTRF